MHQVAQKTRVNTIVVDADSVQIPSWVADLESFRSWAHSDEFPEKVPVSFLSGEVWVDMSREQFAHNQIKGAFSSTLIPLADERDFGRYFSDGYLLSNSLADLSTNPDGMFASTDAFRAGRVRLVEGSEEGYVELQGSPDMALEVVSRSSVHKDLVLLPELYWRAEVREYWIVDPRNEPLRFRILRRDVSGFVEVADQAGWLPSTVFNKSFRLTRNPDSLGFPRFVLELR